VHSLEVCSAHLWLAGDLVHAALYSLFCGPHRTRPEQRTNRAHGVFVAAWTGRRSRREQSDRDETIQFDGRRAAPRTDRTIRPWAWLRQATRRTETRYLCGSG